MANELRNPNDFFDLLPSFFDGRLLKDKEWFPQSLDSFKADIQETDTEYHVHVDLPGYKKEDISIDYNQDMLTIQAKREENKEEKQEENNYIRRERSYGSVSRQFYLSQVKEDDIHASYKEGVLQITLPKKEDGEERKQINIE